VTLTRRDDPARLGVLVGDLHRIIDRRMALDFTQPKPPESHLALLRLVAERPGTTVRQAADSLLMQPTHVSALVSQLVADGELVRQQDEQDRRVAHLFLTAQARARTEQAAVALGEIVAAGLDRLTAEQRDALIQALPALAALRDALT
jgi:DNA-binding MarR family transcriptional regulator